MSKLIDIRGHYISLTELFIEEREAVEAFNSMRRDLIDAKIKVSNLEYKLAIFQNRVKESRETLVNALEQLKPVVESVEE